MGGGGQGHSRTPLATPLLLKIQIHVGTLKSGGIFRASRKVSVEYMNAEKRRSGQKCFEKKMSLGLSSVPVLISRAECSYQGPLK